MTLLLVVVAVAATAQAGGIFMPAGDMTAARSQHRATLLPDGRVLITGGYGIGNQILSSAEVYDPSTGTFARTADMTVPRRLHTTTLLPDGKVLIAGGFNEIPTNNAEIYDPATGKFAATGPLIAEQGCHSATLLANGKVLIAGGQLTGGNIAAPELYDPATGIFSPAGNYAGRATPWGGPMCATANLLDDGRVLLIGGNRPEVYDPIAGTFTFAATFSRGSLEMQTATTLRDGTVLVTGGNDDDTCGGFADAEIFDPSLDAFIDPRTMTEPRDLHTATLLNDGTVLLAGGGDGWCGSSTHATAEIFDPRSRSFAAAGRMSQSRTSHSATLLNDGSVLIAGGVSYWPASTTSSAERFFPAHPAGRPVGRR